MRFVPFELGSGGGRITGWGVGQVIEEHAKKFKLDKLMSEATYWERMNRIGIFALPKRTVAAELPGDAEKRLEFCRSILKDADEWWEENKKRFFTSDEAGSEKEDTIGPPPDRFFEIAAVCGDSKPIVQISVGFLVRIPL